jgi:hypothetical protein
MTTVHGGLVHARQQRGTTKNLVLFLAFAAANKLLHTLLGALTPMSTAISGMTFSHDNQNYSETRYRGIQS